MGRGESSGRRGGDARHHAVLQEGRELAVQARARAEELVAEALAAKARIARDFWEIGRVLILLRAEGLLKILGYDKVEELAEDRLGLSRSTTWKLLSVAVSLPREEASKLGYEKSYAVVSLARVAPELGSPEDIVLRDVEVEGRPVSAASVRELREVIAARRPRPPVRLVDRKQAEEDRGLVAGLRAKLKPVGVPRDAVRVEGEHVVVRLTRAQAARLMR